MKIFRMKKEEPGRKAMLCNYERMGYRLGTNVMVLFVNHPDKRCKDVIIHDEETGEKIIVTF